MSLLVTVQRGAGDNPASEDVTLDYFASELFARALGRVILDERTPGLKRVAGTLLGVRPFIRPGCIIRHQDMRQGDCRGAVEDFSGTISQGEDGRPSVSIGLTFKRMTPA